MAVPRVVLPMLDRHWLCYAMDFVNDQLANGRRFKCLTMTDPCSKEVPMIEVDGSISGQRVCCILDRILAGQPFPETLILDNGPEFSGTALDAWASPHEVQLHFIQPGKPDQNAFIDRFNRTYRTEVLNAFVFESLAQVLEISAEWLQSYNEKRPHESLAGLPPATYRAQLHKDLFRCVCRSF